MEYIDKNNILHFPVESEFWNKVIAGKAKEVRIEVTPVWLRLFCKPHDCSNDCKRCYAASPWKHSINNKVKYINFHCIGQSESLSFKIEKISIEGDNMRWGSGLNRKCFVISFSEKVNELLDLDIQVQNWESFTRYLIFSSKGSVIFEKHNNPLSWGGYAYIFGLWVVDEYRKQGIARQLLDKAEEIAQSIGCKDVCLEWVNTTPNWTLQWYYRQGYRDLELGSNSILLIKEFRKLYTIEKTQDDFARVDLELPSGLLWATCNVGASSPEQAGLYFAWGGTTGFTAEQIARGEKLFIEKAYEEKEIKQNLTLEQDAAHANLGGKWRMPTETEFQELIDNCNAAWTDDYNGTGVAGKLFTSKTNGNSVFFPASGYCIYCSALSVGSVGGYWSASWDSSRDACYLYFDSGSQDINNHNRCCGFPVRGVCKR